MAAVARQSLLKRGVGERLLANKLQILSGLGGRRPTSMTLNLLTGRSMMPRPLTLEHPSTLPGELSTAGRVKGQFSRRTVYLAERHLRDIDRIIAVWSQVESKPLNRSAVVRRAIAHLRTLVEAEKD
jgi:hypothetical protein